MRVLIIVGLAAALSACGSKGDVRVEEESKAYAGPVCITRAPLPSSVAYEVVDEELEEETFGKGSDDEAFGLLADAAREAGANVVMKARTSRAMGIILVSQTGAEGVGVKVADLESFDCEKVGGKVY